MEEMHTKRSNAGAIQDDEEETRRKEEQVKLKYTKHPVSGHVPADAIATSTTNVCNIARTNVAEFCEILPARQDLRYNF